MFVTDGGNNETGWGNPQYDQMLADLGEHGRSRASACSILHDMEKILVRGRGADRADLFLGRHGALSSGQASAASSPTSSTIIAGANSSFRGKSQMTALILRRLLQAIPVLFIVVSLTFLLVRSAPGNPFSNGKATSAPEIMEQLEKQYDLHGTLCAPVRRNTCGKVVHGDLGLSTQYRNRTVNEIIAQTLPVSMVLGALAYVLALRLRHHPAAGGRRCGTTSAGDRALMLVALLGISIPSFVSAPLLVMVFAIWLRACCPRTGWGSPDQIILPAFCLSLPFAATIARLTRGSLLEVLQARFRPHRAREGPVRRRRAFPPRAQGRDPAGHRLQRPGRRRHPHRLDRHRDDFRHSGHRPVFRQQRAQSRSVHDLRRGAGLQPLPHPLQLLADILYFVVDRRVKME